MCENALTEALTHRDFSELAMLRRFARFSVWKYS
jgi:hypothetical protein